MILFGKMTSGVVSRWLYQICITVVRDHWVKNAIFYESVWQIVKKWDADPQQLTGPFHGTDRGWSLDVPLAT